MSKKEIDNSLADLSASYQEAIIDTLLDKINKVIYQTKIYNISIAGGVAANQRLRYKTKLLLKEHSNLNIIFPKVEYCTDNAAMIAMAGYHKILKKEYSNYNLLVSPNSSLNDNKA